MKTCFSLVRRIPWGKLAILLICITIVGEGSILIWQIARRGWTPLAFPHLLVPFICCIVGFIILLSAQNILLKDNNSIRSVTVYPDPSLPEGQDSEIDLSSPEREDVFTAQTVRLSGRKVEQIFASESGVPEAETKNMLAVRDEDVSIKVRVFVVPKEGKDPRRSEDKYGIDEALQCYAVTDGVGTAFLSSQWAQIIASRFVECRGDFANEQNFRSWLEEGSRQWRYWAEQVWIPEAQQVGLDDDWERLLRRGPQTTLVGCSLTLASDGVITIDVSAVGDAHFFLYKSPVSGDGKWNLESHPYTCSNDFGPIPETLGTSPKRIQRAYELIKRRRYMASPSDYVLLATDALAKWIFVQRERGEFAWLELLKLTNDEAFKAFVFRERACNEIELDDTTLLVIPLRLVTRTV